MIEIGRLCVKIAGRDAGKKALIIDILEDKYVLIDGETRRRKCNVLHIEPLSQKVDIKKNASHDEVAKALKEFGIGARQTNPKPKTQRPRAKRKTPEQLRKQKEEKRKFKDLFKPKKKEVKEENKETTLEARAGVVEREKEEGKEEKSAKKETKPKAEKPKAANKEAKKKE